MNETTVGQPIPRVDGVLKVTGRATYAAEHNLPNLAHAVMVTSTVAKGRIKRLDVTAAEHAAGVLAVITYLNAPKLPYREQKSALDPSGERLHVLQDDRVRFNGQPMAVVVAETLDQAEYAASLVRIEYAQQTPRLDLTGGLEHAVVADAVCSPIRRCPPTRVGVIPNAPSPRLPSEWRPIISSRGSSTTPWSHTPPSRAGKATG